MPNCGGDQPRSPAGQATGWEDKPSIRNQTPDALVRSSSASRYDVSHWSDAKGHSLMFAATDSPQRCAEALLEVSNADISLVDAISEESTWAPR